MNEDDPQTVSNEDKALNSKLRETNTTVSEEGVEEEVGEIEGEEVAEGGEEGVGGNDGKRDGGEGGGEVGGGEENEGEGKGGGSGEEEGEVKNEEEGGKGGNGDKEEEKDDKESGQLTTNGGDTKEKEPVDVDGTTPADSKAEGEGGEGAGRGSGSEEGGEDSPRERERKAYKDQLLKSAGIQLQGSSEPDITGAPPKMTVDTAQSSQDRNLEQFSEILLDSDLSPTDSETGLSVPGGEGEGEGAGEGEGQAVGEGEEGAKSKPERRVRFADEVMESTDTADSQPQSSPRPESLPTGPPAASSSSPRHSGNIVTPSSPRLQSPRSPSAPHTPEEIIAGVNYSAEYMGSTPIILTGIASAKTARMQQAQQVVKLFRDPENDVLPRFPVTIRISSQSIKIIDSTAGVDLMDHSLYTISYVADIENVLVIMINRVLPAAPGEVSQGGEAEKKGEKEEKEGGEGETGRPGSGEEGEGVKEGVEVGESEKKEAVVGGGTEGGGEGGSGEEEFNGVGPIPRMTCHVLETNDARHVAMVIGQAFSVAYKEFLRATGISEEALEQAEYAHILNAQTAPQAELDLLRDRDEIRKLSLAKRKGDILGLMVMESGYGSALPTPVIAHLSKTGSAVRSGQLNVGDHIIAINGVNMVGMPVKVCIDQLKKCRYQNLVKMTVVSCPTVVDITIVRPDLKFQLGFTIQDGVVRSLTRGSIAERSGVRVGHFIIEINGTSTVGLSHKDLVHLLTTTVGDLHLKTMPHLMYKLITGQVIPVYH